MHGCIEAFKFQRSSVTNMFELCAVLRSLRASVSASGMVVVVW